MPPKTVLKKKIETPLREACDYMKLREVEWRFYSPKGINFDIPTDNSPPFLTTRRKGAFGYSKILLIVGEDTHEISYVNHIGKEKCKSIFDNTSEKYYKTFAEINDNEGPCFDENGKPRISVLYGNDRIHIGHLF